MNISAGLISTYRRNVYFRGVVALLITVIAFPVVTGCYLCDDFEDYNQYLRSECGTSNWPDWLYWIGYNLWFLAASSGDVKSYGTVEITGSVEARGSNAGSKNNESFRLEWTPAPGATAFEFRSGQPSNPEGPPPFLFTDLDTGTAVNLAYQAPALPAGRSELVLVDTFEVVGSTGRQASSLRTWVTENPGEPRSAYTVWFDHETSPLAPKANSQDTAMFHWQQYIYPRSDEIPMDEDYCQAWLDLFQDESIFLALRFPLTDWLASDTGSYALPLVFNNGVAPRIELITQRNSPSVVEGLLEYRPKHQTFLENEMPPGDGFAWLALGSSSSSPDTCPPFPQHEEYNWELHTDLVLDLGSDDLQDEVTLEAYLCFDHDAALASNLESHIKATSFPSWNINCIGAMPLRITPFETDPDPPIHLSGPSGRFVDPPEDEVWLHHYLRSLSDNPISVQLESSSSLGLDWSIYGGTWDEPSRGTPLTEPVGLDPDNNFLNIWLLAEVPEGTSGVENVRVTATLEGWPEQPLWTTSIVSINNHEQLAIGQMRRPSGRRSN